jgi:uncharacterized protein (TIGR00725 family)
MKQRKIQIVVIGSAADKGLSAVQNELAQTIGKELAMTGATLVYGAERDTNSLSTEVARAMKASGGMVIGVTYGKGLDDIYGEADVVIATGLDRGGGREMALCFSCDAIITIGGGSGTMTEMGIAYQARIPMVALANSGGWSEKMAGKYFDERKRIIVSTADTPKVAVQLAIELAKERRRQLESVMSSNI